MNKSEYIALKARIEYELLNGTGPAGLFVAHELQKHHKKLYILIFDKGMHPELRHCPMLTEPHSNCSREVCGLVQGGGGAVV